jgi:hypothetical protein
LSWFATEEISAPATAVTETSRTAEGSATGPDSTPVALADRLEAVPWEPHIGVQEPRIAADVPLASVATAATDSANRADDRPKSPSHGGHADYRGRQPNLALGLFLVVAFVVVGGGLYWIWLNQTPSTDSPAGLPGTEPTMSTPAAAPQAADTPTKSSEPPPENPPSTAGSPPSSASAPEPSAPVRQSSSPNGESGPPVAEAPDSSAKAAESTASEAKVQPPPVIDPASKSMAARKPSGTVTEKSSRAGTAKTTTARASSTPAHSIGAPVRTTEQEERDAIATRRLIERDLANSPLATSGDKAPPSQ